jgi:hypothetical protein
MICDEIPECACITFQNEKPHIDVRIFGQTFNMKIDTGCGTPIHLSREKFDRLFPNVSIPRIESIKRLYKENFQRANVGGIFPKCIKFSKKILEEISEVLYIPIERDVHVGVPTEECKGLCYDVFNVPVSFGKTPMKSDTVNVCHIKVKRLDENGKTELQDIEKDYIGLSAFKNFAIILCPIHKRGYLCNPAGLSMRCEYHKNKMNPT